MGVCLIALLGVGMRNKKPSSKREPKKEPKPKTLEEVCRSMLAEQAEARREKIAAERREEHRAEEDAVMAMIYGPDWATRDL
jgi:hypothetical protein